MERVGDTTAGQTRPVYTRVQVSGLVLAAATMLVVAVVAVVTNPASIGEVAGFIAPFAGGSLIAAWLAWKFGTWAKIVGVLVGLVIGVMMFWAVFGLFEIDNFVDFAFGVGVPVGVLLAVFGGVAAVMSSRKGRLAAEATQGERRLLRTLGAVIVVALVVSAVLTMLGRTTVDPAAAAGATHVEMVDFEFEPSPIEVSSADGRIVVVNRDAFVHDLTVPALDAEVRLTGGSSGMVDLTGAAPGVYTAYCTLHSDVRVDDPAEAGMAVALIVN